jgi:hypothetical protein
MQFIYRICSWNHLWILRFVWNVLLYT